MSNDEYIVLVALDSAYTLVSIVPNALFPAKPTEGRLGVTLYVHGLLACYRCAHCLLRKNGKMA